MGIVISIAEVKITTPQNKNANSGPVVGAGVITSGSRYGNSSCGYAGIVGVDASSYMMAHSRGEIMYISKEELKKKITNLGLKYRDMKTEEALAYVDSNDKAYYSDTDLNGLIEFAKNNWGLVIRED